VREDDVLGAAVSRGVTELPIGQLRKLAQAISSCDEPTAIARHSIINTVPTALFRHHAATICDAWKSTDDTVSGRALAMMIQAAANAVDTVRGEQEVSVVWTGPASYEVPVRATSVVLEEVIDEARNELLVVSFAAYKVAAIVTALHSAAVRGVTVRLVLESAVESQGRLSHDASEAFDTLGDAVSFYVWPAELRLTAHGHAAMHAKCAVADGKVAFVTSANLTGAAMTENMELGLVVRGGDVPRRIADHFAALIEDAILERVVK
jgi:phosphatidylserine/phosphatidylglycerophosphate/cardiolipin synthase-like enzyme